MQTVGGCGCTVPTTAAVEECYCTVDDLVHVIGRKYTLPVLVRIGSGTARFTGLQRALGVSSSTLSETLDDLIRIGLVRRTVVEDRPPTTEYVLTAAGTALREHLRPLLERVRAME